jgi:acyl-CoA synthetase (AMP-forming)/AMP-acid ligase II
MTITDLLTNSAAAFPEKPAAIHHDRQLTFAGLYERSGRLAHALNRSGIPVGSRMAILCENSLEYIIAFFGSAAAALVTVPVDTSLAPEKIAFILRDCDAAVLFVQGKFRRHLAQIVADLPSLKLIICDKSLDKIDLPYATGVLDDMIEHAPKPQAALPITKSLTEEPHQLGAVFYTSGSTGVSKGVMLSHRNLVSNTLATVEYLRLTVGESVMVILPFYYIYGNSLLLTHIACGGTVVLDNRFMYPEVVLDEMEARCVNGFSGVPSHFMILLNNSTFPKRRFEHLRYFTQAGGAMAPEVIRTLADTFPSKELWIMYGQTEAAPRITYLPPERLREKLGSIGIEVPGVTIEILHEDGSPAAINETGELVASGDNVMLGYLNQPEETAQVLKNGKLYTGDLARRDADGYIWITGRRREIIKAGGNRVSAREVEERILEHEGVAEVAVFGVFDDVLGEAIKAVVVNRNGTTLDRKEIQVFVQQKLAIHKVPKYVEFVAELPKLQSGKVNKLLLKEQALQAGK